MFIRLEKEFKLPRRLIAFLLCLCIVMSTVIGVGIMTAFAYFGPTQNIVEQSRKADPNTMDDYRKQLLSTEWGSRYAGRIWTDKSVFAYGADDKNGGVDKNLITLDMNTDGYDGYVGFNADFAHVFSALASSQVVNEYPPTPIDLVIVFDMSASMGQDTRYGIDTGLNMYVEHNTDGDSQGQTWPEVGVPMAERIKNSRIQHTLDAINQTIDKLMAQNPQNRVAVCGYGANAVVLMPLGHYKKAVVNDVEQPYLTVGGMETLYHPSDLVYREPGDNLKKGDTTLLEVAEGEEGWYWMNNRDTCYTVVVNAQYNTYTGVLNKATGDGTGQTDANGTDTWQSITKTVSNNVLTDDGTKAKAFPGAWNNDGKTPLDTYKKESKKVYEGSSSKVPETAAMWAGGAYGYTASDKGVNGLKGTMLNTSALEAEDYVGYFTNTQGGIYIAYKQLADSTATTYTETLTNGVMSTVARIPAAIIMSDGGANFSFNEMGKIGETYTAADWNVRYGQRGPGYGNMNYIEDNSYTNSNSSATWEEGRVDGREIDFLHRLNEIGQLGDEWYNVFIPGADTLEGWNGLYGLYNWGADIFEDGTLTTPPAWEKSGVFYSSDNDVTGTAGTVMEVLLTASYMSSVVKKHYTKGWTTDSVTEESKSDLFTYTMNVDTDHVPLWGKMRLYTTLDPKDYNLNDIDKWYTDSKNDDKFGTDGTIQNSVHYADLKNNITKRLLFDGGTVKGHVINGLKQAWEQFSKGNRTSGPNQINEDGSPINIAIEPISAEGVTYNAGGDDVITVKNDDVVDNIAYNDEFFDVSSRDIDETFSKILELILGNVFVPVSGDNDAGVGDSITYQDPLGEYMEIKNQSISALTHKDEDEGKNDPGTYDMSLLLFGEMHGLVRAGVYDWNWNDRYMRANNLNAGNAAFPMGWYRGDDPENAETPQETGKDEAGTYPTKSQDGTETYTSAAEARAAGWVFRLDYKTLLQFVPITGVDETDPNFHPSSLPAQVKNTVYTCYRFAGSQDERNELRRNPIFGTDVPKEIQEAWDAAIKDGNGEYPDDNTIYKDTPGVYRLSDIRVWVEDTGDFIDTDGAIAPNSGYDRSLYLNVPAAAVPTQLATVTLGPDGVLSYLTNLATDKKDLTYDQIKNYSAQSTPLRLFYAVGLEDDLLLKSEDGKTQIGVDFTKISAEYIEKHTVEGQDYVWFISNYYSNTTYDEYVTDSSTYRTRGDPTVTFSPSVDNRYYVFQKPLPLYAHAYRVTDDGLKPVDDINHNGVWDAKENQTGNNGSKTWEGAADGVTGGGSWSGGEFMGTYAGVEAFNNAKAAVATNGGYITDSTGIRYPYIKNGIVFLEGDLLDHVTSGDDGSYAEGSVSFNSNDYFFILVEYYLPNDAPGYDVNEKEVPNSHGGRMFQYVVARRGSEFGSAFASDKIDNGDMLCWTDMNGHITKELAYLSKTDTGDKTRGEPTWQKLTYTNNDLRTYLKDKCGITKEEILDQQVKYWTDIQNDEGVKAALEAAKNGDDLSQDEFNKAFKFAVAARPGGIRTGDMSNNIHTKKGDYNSETGYYEGNITHTANNYYVPTVSDNSATDNGVILNTYLGNNGYLEIANQMLNVTKMLEAPEGFELTDEAKNEEFNYQIYVQGVTGKRTAALTQYNEYAKTWERQLAYIDVLTDNSDLVLDSGSNRAVFIKEDEGGAGSQTVTAKMVIANGNDAEGKPIYYVANEDGTLTFDENGGVDTKANPPVESGMTLYYMYLPPNSTTTDLTAHSRRLYQNINYDGKDDGYVLDGDNTYDEVFAKNGTTTFFAEGQRDETGSTPGVENRDSYRKTTDSENRPAGTRTYWAQDAELIPKVKVDEFKNPTEEPGGAEPTASNVWTHSAADHETEGHVDLTYFTFVIGKPNDETSETNFISPFKTRTLYMSKTLIFGKNDNDDGDNKKGKALEAVNLYDKVIPSADRPDLFGDSSGKLTLANGRELTIDSDYIAAHTAEFTLKHGEGLLLSGLDNRITYRFTEKLTEEQLKAGYTLKRISHIQQRGSESIYLPGVQQIPIYTDENATYSNLYPNEIKGRKTENGLTWAIDQYGAVNPATPNLEPFAHTNATMWMYYATMDLNSSGNHHQRFDEAAVETEKKPQVWSGNTNQYTEVGTLYTVPDNPSCKTCDEPITNDAGETTGYYHYMYKNGVLVDPHYEGEASSYMRNMSRYGVSPTVHFGVNGEEGMKDVLTSVPSKILENQASGDKEYYDYNGVYSVYGNTGWFEEQANFVNTIEPDMLVVTKEVVDKSGTHVAPTPDMVFEYTLELADIASEDKTIPALTGYDTLYLWRGSKDTMQSVLKWTDKGAPEKEYTMPAAAPNLDEYREFIPTADSPMEGKTYLQPVTLKEEEDGKLTYEFKLKADEAVVFYGLPAGTDYTVTEIEIQKYPISKTHDDDPYSARDYAQTGEILHYRETSPTVNHVAMRASETGNRKNYYNEMSTGMLTVEKRIEGDEPDTKKDFGFTITLTPAPGTELKSEDLEATKYKADGTAYVAPEFTIRWEPGGDDLKAEVTLKHGERIVIGGIPINTEYTVKETGRGGYNLQHVASNPEDKPEDAAGNYLTLENDSVTGKITTDTTDKATEKAQVYLLFVNEKAPFLPFVGGMGVVAIVLIGVLLIGLATALIVQKKNRRRRNA